MRIKENVVVFNCIVVLLVLHKKSIVGDVTYIYIYQYF